MSGKNAIYLHRAGSVSAAVQLYRMGTRGCLFCSKRKKILQPRIFQSAPLSGIRHNDGYSDPFVAGAGDKMAAAVSDHLDGRVRCGIFFRRDRSQNLEKAFVELSLSAPDSASSNGNGTSVGCCFVFPRSGHLMSGLHLFIFVFEN